MDQQNYAQSEHDAFVSEHRATGPQPGWIYCLTNESVRDQVKIGFTTQDVESRMRQLDTTGVATPFLVCRKWLSADVRRDERNIHQMLSKYRTRSNREWFMISAEKQPQLIAALNKYMLKANGAYYHLDTSAPVLQETLVEKLTRAKRLTVKTVGPAAKAVTKQALHTAQPKRKRKKKMSPLTYLFLGAIAIYAIGTMGGGSGAA